MDSSEKMKYSLKRRFIRWMEDNRGLILTVIGLPASFIFDLVMEVSILVRGRVLPENWAHGSGYPGPGPRDCIPGT